MNQIRRQPGEAGCSDRYSLPSPSGKGIALTSRHSGVRVPAGVRVLSSVAERRLDTAGAPRSIRGGRTILASESERRGPRPITEWQVVRLHPLAPVSHGDPERSPEWRGSSLLSCPQVDRNHPGSPDQCPERQRERPLKPLAKAFVGSSPTWFTIHRRRNERTCVLCALEQVGIS